MQGGGPTTTAGRRSHRLLVRTLTRAVKQSATRRLSPSSRDRVQHFGSERSRRLENSKKKSIFGGHLFRQREH